MPLRMSIPLPGPFSYSSRVKAPGPGFGRFLYYLLIAWWVLPMVWLFTAMWLLCKYTAIVVARLIVMVWGMVR